MLYTKSILKPISLEDGVRISVMSRHTLDDGITPDTRITLASYNLWVQELAPPAKLVGDYYKRGLPWESYEAEYLHYLKQEGIMMKVQELAQTALEKDVTLLCKEEQATRCHRRILAEECQRYQQGLKVEHR